MEKQSCLVRAIIIYFVGGFVLSVAIGFGYVSYEMWAIFAEDPMLFTFCFALAFSTLSIALVVPLFLLVIGKRHIAKLIFFSASIPATGIAFMLAADALVIDLYLAMGTEFSIELSFPVMVLCVGICAVLTALVFALSFRLIKKPALARATLKRVCLPFACLALGATVWAFLMEWLIADLTGLEQIIHFIAITGAVGGVAVGGAAFFAFKRILLGFFSGVGVAIVFLDYLVYGCIKMFQIPSEFYWIIAVGFIGLYFLLGLVYCLARFKKIRGFVSEGVKRYWLVN